MKTYLNQNFSTLIVLMLGMVLLPQYSYAVTFRTIAGGFVDFLNNVAGILFLSLVTGMIFAVIVFLINSDNESKRQEIKGYLFWGVIGIAVTFGVWGILNLLLYSLGWGDGGLPFLRPPT